MCKNAQDFHIYLHKNLESCARFQINICPVDYIVKNHKIFCCFEIK
jgi:hypothetical protein